MTADALTKAPIALTERTSRLLDLRRAIMEGTYKVDADAVAAALLRSWSSKAGNAAATPQESPPATLESMRRFVVQPTVAVEPPCERRILGA